MQQADILTINCGSSSLKFARYQYDGRLAPTLAGAVEGIGAEKIVLRAEGRQDTELLAGHDHATAANSLIGWLQAQPAGKTCHGIGHRIVHGMQHTEPQVITPQLLEALKAIAAYDPEHLPAQIAWIEAFQKHFPATPQVACFDTTFHDTMPMVAKRLPLPRVYHDKGIRRYGFHGLSYRFLLEELWRVAGSQAEGRIVMAHLGNGASLAAVKAGKSIDTTMAFTPASGIPMSTRAGDLDPGVAWYLLQIEKLSPDEFNHLVNRQSGLKGISETSGDMRELLGRCGHDNRAEEAIALFCYQVKKNIGAFAAALGGLDTLIFTGGIGEHAADVRGRICHDLRFLGIEINEIRNRQHEPVISTDQARVQVRVMATNEQVMIARLACEVLGLYHEM